MGSKTRKVCGRWKRSRLVRALATWHTRCKVRPRDVCKVFASICGRKITKNRARKHKSLVQHSNTSRRLREAPADLFLMLHRFGGLVRTPLTFKFPRRLNHQTDAAFAAWPRSFAEILIAFPAGYRRQISSRFEVERH